MNRDQQDAINAIYDEAIVAHGHDHVAAASQVFDELQAMEAAGHAWVRVALDAMALQVLVRRVKDRGRRSVISVPSRTGLKTTMPAKYSTQRADGSRQLSFWMDLPLVELRSLIEDIQIQTNSGLARAGRMRHGLELAERHGVDTAREGFAAEGIEIAEGVA